jgi:hypothetical protein
MRVPHRIEEAKSTQCALIMITGFLVRFYSFNVVVTLLLLV